MRTPDTAAAIPGRTGPPWTAEGTVYFYGGWLSNFTPTPDLRLPRGYFGHHENDRVPVRSVEHFFQACKATSRRKFDLILACNTAAAAKRAGRETELRPDWQQVKFEVMLCALRGKFTLEPYRGGAPADPPAPDRRGQRHRLHLGRPRSRRRLHRAEPAGACADTRPRRADRRRAHAPDGARARPLKLRARSARTVSHPVATARRPSRATPGKEPDESLRRRRRAGGRLHQRGKGAQPARVLRGPRGASGVGARSFRR